MRIDHNDDDEIEKINQELRELGEEEISKEMYDQYTRIMDSLRRSIEFHESHQKEIESVKRETVIGKDDIQDLIITLNTTKDVNEFIEKI